MVVGVSGSAANSQGVTSPDDVSLTIRDDDSGPLTTLTLSSPSISENGGTATITASLSSAATAAVTIEVSVVDSVDSSNKEGFNLSSNAC